MKEVVKSMKEADKLLEKTPPRYGEALEVYLKANDFNPHNALLNYKIGMCYLHGMQKTKAIPYLEMAIKLNPKAAPDLKYLMARAYHYNYECDNHSDRIIVAGPAFSGSTYSLAESFQTAIGHYRSEFHKLPDLCIVSWSATSKSNALIERSNSDPNDVALNTSNLPLNTSDLALNTRDLALNTPDVAVAYKPLVNTDDMKVKEIAKMGGNISHFVSPLVEERVLEKLKG